MPVRRVDQEEVAALLDAAPDQESFRSNADLD